ncbi:MAG: hypothetical protein WAK71_09580 [Streptosporangiaceae bacterium]|jgi:hypothetical protein
MLSSLPVRASAAWMSRGACQGEDPEMFFPIATMQDGIWGGTTAEERRVLRRLVAPLLNPRTGRA